ncbi:unnamed protein product [Chrysoparadoxa australica]
MGKDKAQRPSQVIQIARLEAVAASSRPSSPTKKSGSALPPLATTLEANESSVAPSHGTTKTKRHTYGPTSGPIKELELELELEEDMESRYLSEWLHCRKPGQGWGGGFFVFSPADLQLTEYTDESCTSAGIEISLRNGSVKALGRITADEYVVWGFEMASAQKDGSEYITLGADSEDAFMTWVRVAKQYIRIAERGSYRAASSEPADPARRDDASSHVSLWHDEAEYDGLSEITSLSLGEREMKARPQTPNALEPIDPPLLLPEPSTMGIKVHGVDSVASEIQKVISSTVAGSPKLRTRSIVQISDAQSMGADGSTASIAGSTSIAALSLLTEPSRFQETEGSVGADSELLDLDLADGEEQPPEVEVKLLSRRSRRGSANSISMTINSQSRHEIGACGAGDRPETPPPKMDLKLPPELGSAVAQGNREELENYIRDHRSDFDSQLTEEGLTLLGLAVREATTASDLVQVVLNAGAAVNRRDKLGRTALWYAACNNSRELVNLLLARNARCELQDVEGSTPIMMACLNGSQSLVETFLDSGADPCVSDFRGFTAFLVAAAGGHWTILETILSSHPDIDLNHKTLQGISPLYAAVMWGALSATQFLLERGADINIRSLGMDTPLHVACEFQQVDVFELVLAAGPHHCNSKNEYGETPIFRLIRTKAPKMELLRKLLDGGTDVNHPNWRGDTVYQVAVELKKDEIAKELLARGADPEGGWVEIKGVDGGTTRAEKREHRRLGLGAEGN